MCHIGNRDPDDETALILRIGVGCCKAGVVMVAGICRVDGDKWQVAQVFSALEACRLHGVGFGDHVIGEIIRDAVLMDGDQGYCLGRRGITQPGDDARLRQAKPVFRAGLLGLDQLTILCAMGRTGWHPPFAIRALVDRQNAPAFRSNAEDAENAAWVGADAADQTALVGVILFAHVLQAREDTITRSKRGIGRARHQKDHRLRPLALPFQRTCKEIPVTVWLKHLHDRNGRQLFRVAIGLAALLQMAVGLELFQEAFQVNPVRALDAEGLGDITFRGLGRIVRYPVENFRLCGDARHVDSLSCGAVGVTGEFQD